MRGRYRVRGNLDPQYPQYPRCQGLGVHLKIKLFVYFPYLDAIGNPHPTSPFMSRLESKVFLY